jgi:hypothetical protein
MEPNEPVKNPDKQPDPYAFIMKSNGGSSTLSKLSPFGNMSNKIKLAVMGGGVIFLLIVISIVYSSLLKKPENSNVLANVGRQQAQILQAADIGTEKARGQAARNLAITTRLSLIDDQKALKAALSGKNVRYSTSKDKELEQTLIRAEQANQFDDKLLEYLHTELSSYARNLQAAYNSTEKQEKDLRAVLANQYKNARYLAGESVGEQSQ